MTPGEELWQLELENEGLEEGATRKNNKLCQNFTADVGRSHYEGRKGEKVRMWKGDKYELC